METHLSHFRRETRLELLLNESQEKIYARIPTTAGNELPIPAVDVMGRAERREELLKGRLAFPVEGETSII